MTSRTPTSSNSSRSFWRSRWFSLRAALVGAVYVLRTQRNAWIEMVALFIVVGAAWSFGLQPLEWAVVGVAISVIFALEAINTAIEATVDLISPHYHPLAKIAKDTAAGALLFAVLGSLAVAAAIFGPRLLALLPR